MISRQNPHVKARDWIDRYPRTGWYVAAFVLLEFLMWLANH